MPLFGKRIQNRSLLPSDIVQRMEYYGRFEFSPQQSEPDAPHRIAELIYQQLYPIASADPDRFIAELADAVLPVGGWAVYGGERCVRDLINAQTRHPGFVAMIDAAMEFLRSQGYGVMHVAPFEREVWCELHPGGRW
jgi:hypothetical protein